MNLRGAALAMALATTSFPAASGITGHTSPPRLAVRRSAAQRRHVGARGSTRRRRTIEARGSGPAFSRGSAAARPAPASTVEVDSTAYCLTGTMADGLRVHVGAVAGNAWPLGTELEVSSSPMGARRVVVEDRIGYGSSLDFALPGNCAAAFAWGRRPVRVRVLPAVH